MSKEARRYDHVYDPIQALSGKRDFARSTTQAAVTTIDRVPAHNNYFSQIPSKYRDHHMRVSRKIDLPVHMNATYRPPQSNPARGGSILVSGSHRSKYFKRPVVPFLESTPPEILLSKADLESGNAEENKVPEEGIEPYSRVRDIGSQTVFRESEAQTDPFTPDYVVAPGSDPEVLQLAHLTYANGDLPATMKEVTLIERKRFQKLIESSLPPITDEASFELRRKLMERLELFHFNNRNKDIDAVQKERLQFMKNALDKREAENEFISEQRIEQLRRSELIEKDIAIAAIQHNRIKALRKLSRARKLAEPLQPRGRKIIKEYSRFSSRVYAPILREGQFPNQNGLSHDSLSVYKNGLNVLDELEQSIPKHYMYPTITKPKKKVLRGSKERKRQFIRSHLEKMNTLIKDKHRQQEAQNGKDAMDGTQQRMGDTRWNRKIEKSDRPKTPRVSKPTINESFNNAVVLLQRLVKGRAIQNAMYHGKEKRLQLIHELKLEKRQVDLSSQQARIVRNAVIDTIKGSILSKSLIFLTQELKRANDEKRLQDVIAHASEVRRIKEVEEMGRRQAEERIRDRATIVTQQIMEVHKHTVDSYLDDILQQVIMNQTTPFVTIEQQVIREQAKKTVREATSHATKLAIQQEVDQAVLLDPNDLGDDREYINSAQQMVVKSMTQVEAA